MSILPKSNHWYVAIKKQVKYVSSLGCMHPQYLEMFPLPSKTIEKATKTQSSTHGCPGKSMLMLDENYTS